jgi:hypothetical protein
MRYVSWIGGGDDFDLPLALSRTLYVSFSSIPRHLPDDALSPEFAIESGIEAITTGVNIQAFATFPAKTRFVLLADRHCFPVRVFFTLHI